MVEFDKAYETYLEKLKKLNDKILDFHEKKASPSQTLDDYLGDGFSHAISVRQQYKINSIRGALFIEFIESIKESLTEEQKKMLAQLISEQQAMCHNKLASIEKRHTYRLNDERHDSDKFYEKITNAFQAESSFLCYLSEVASHLGLPVR